MAAEHSLFYDWLRYLLLFRRGAAIKTAEEKNHSPNQRITTVFLEEPLVLPGSAKYNRVQMHG